LFAGARSLSVGLQANTSLMIVMFVASIIAFRRSGISL
jgi:hypothetical protein